MHLVIGQIERIGKKGFESKLWVIISGLFKNILEEEILDIDNKIIETDKSDEQISYKRNNELLYFDRIYSQ